MPLLSNFMKKINKSDIGEINSGMEIDAILLKKLDFETKNHPIEKVGLILRENMSKMKKIK